MNCPWCGCTENTSYLKVKDYFLTREEFEILECPQCHLLYTSPRPSLPESQRYYQSNNYFSHQENKSGFIPRVYEFVKSFNIHSKVRMATKGMTPGSALDIGCGVGDFLFSLQRRGWSVNGIEPSSQARNIASKRLGFTPLDPTESPALPDASFDLVTLWHVLEHVDDLALQISELQRLLKPGGRLIIALPNFTSFDAQFYKEHWAAWDVPRHLNHFSPEFMQSMFANLSFQYIDNHKLIWDAFYISYLSESFLNHSLPLIRGFFVGLRSNTKALRSGRYSSLVYRFQKV